MLLEQEEEDWAKRGSVLHNKRMGVVLLIEECMLMLENVDLRCAADNAVSIHELCEDPVRDVWALTASWLCRSIPDQSAAAYCEKFVVHAVVYLGQAEHFPNMPASHPDNRFAGACRELLQTFTNADNQLCNRILAFSHSNLQNWRGECKDKAQPGHLDTCHCLRH